ncbi:hypothetical protein PV518_40215, partial [Streptomyces sp. ND04-05B]|nr:hypothetical protein [Streptomyces sp. ND04-05B]
MRQFSARVRRAAVTALTIAASTGCMSVGEDAGTPVQPRPADRKGAPAEPEGDTVPGTGRAGFGSGRAEAQSDRGTPRKPDPSGSGRAPSAAPGHTRPVPAPRPCP